MKMNPEVKTLWVAALRSGNYKKGYNYMKHVSHEGVATFCCLGVLCDILGVKWKRGANVCEVEGSSTLLPESVRKRAGLLSPFGADVTIEGYTRALTTHNDSLKHTFKQIADAIEAQL